jgi:hypothetical protein
MGGPGFFKQSPDISRIVKRFEGREMGANSPYVQQPSLRHHYRSVVSETIWGAAGHGNGYFGTFSRSQGVGELGFLKLIGQGAALKSGGQNLQPGSRLENAFHQ